MGLIGSLFTMVFGGGRNVIADTAHVFRENAEAGAVRDAATIRQVLAQYGAEFGGPRLGLFDRLMDAVNRLPRPAMALGTLGLFVSAMMDPVWFAERMQGIALVPEPLWWLLGAIVSFYFGARHQVKSQDFQRSLAASVALAPTVVGSIEALRGLNDSTPGIADTGTDAALATRTVRPGRNPALAEWQNAGRKGR